jgi:hypothetical protein
MQVKLPKSEDNANLTWTIGHGGCDWGSIALYSGYNARFNFSLSVASNSVSPMNCSQAYKNAHPVSIGAIYEQVDIGPVCSCA